MITARRRPARVACAGVLAGALTLAVAVAPRAEAAAPASVYAWGFDGGYQLGDGTLNNSPTPIPVDLPPGVVISAVAAGDADSLAVTSAGDIYEWGNDQVLGNLPAPVKVNLPAAVSATRAAVGYEGDMNMVLSSSGAVYDWGGPGSPIGDGSSGSPTPAQVSLPAGVSATAVATGGSHALALSSTGVIYAWGDNSVGELGDGTRNSASTPVLVQLPPGVVATGIAAGSQDSLAVTSTGVVYAWGRTYGDPTNLPIQVSLPAGVTATGVAANRTGVSVLTTAGVVTAKDLILTSSGAVYVLQGTATVRQVVLPAGVSATAVSGGGSYSLVLSSSGAVYAWGANNDGQLGDGTVVDNATPVPTQLPAGLSAAAVAAGGAFGLAVIANTVPGQNVQVTPPDQTGATPVQMSFATVSAAGLTTLTTNSTGPPTPSGFSLGNPATYYNLHTTAQFTTARVCITDPAVTATSVLLHYDAAGNATDVTDHGVSPNPDPVNHVICSTQLSSLSPFAIAQSADTTKPTISLSHSADGQNGWNVTAPVTVAVNATDPDGGGLAGAPTCTDALGGGTPSPLTVSGSEPSYTVSINGEGTHTISCAATDPPGNSATATDTVNIDTRPPSVSYTGNAPSYTVDQTVAISCSASDPAPGSGLASNTCQNVKAPAYSFPVGTSTPSANATDNAGNKGHGSVSFTVQVTPSSLCQLTRQFVESSSNFMSLPPSVRAAIDARLAAICTALSSAQITNPRLKAAAVAAYDKSVQFLAGLGWLTSDHAATLTRLAAGL